MVREISPQLLLTDGQFNVAGYITREAFAQYSKNPSNDVKVTELRDYMITLDSWTLELAHVTADESFSSYAGLEMRLIINKFSKFSQSRVNLPDQRHPQNLYRDDQVCFQINKFLLDAQKAMLEQQLSAKGGQTNAARSVSALEAHCSQRNGSKKTLSQEERVA